jgi:LmbE family N-acetylglucosaminyl deacetylase
VKGSILVLAPHIDDGEFGCGGSIAKFIEEGADVFYAAFSLCELSLPSHLPKDILERELHEAAGVLGLSK